MLLNAATYEAIMGPSSHPLFDEMMVAAGEYLILMLPVIATVLWFRGRDGRQEALLITVAGIVTLGLSYIAGLLYSHPTPFMVMETVVGGVPENGFPSQHTAVTASIVWPLLRRYRGLGIAAAIGALGTGIARIYIGEHFPIDVIGAFVVSIIGYAIVQTIDDRYAVFDDICGWIEPVLPDVLIVSGDEEA